MRLVKTAKLSLKNLLALVLRFFIPSSSTLGYFRFLILYVRSAVLVPRDEGISMWAEIRLEALLERVMRSLSL